MCLRCICVGDIMVIQLLGSSFFFFNDTATTEIYTLSLHDALPIFSPIWPSAWRSLWASARGAPRFWLCLSRRDRGARSEEHTSELQSQSNLVCRLLLEKKKQQLRRPSLRAVQYHRSL